jgi:pyrroloquinoline quinone biosynthesis protein D
MVEPSFRPKRRPEIRIETVDDELVLYDATSGRAAYLNDTAAVVWKLCDGERSVEEIGVLLAREIDGKGRPVAGDVEETIGEFVKAGLVT